MTADGGRYDRNIRLFGAEGQQRLRQCSVAVVGVGGLGSPLSQHLALLGVGHVVLIDDEELDETNRNRFIGARVTDPVPGSPKVQIVERLIAEINPDVQVTALKTGLVTPEAFECIKNVAWVFGCFDEDGPRFVLNELCSAYERPYIDLASDVAEPGAYGGRVCVSEDGNGCLHCLNLLDEDAVRHYLSNREERRAIDRIYGVPETELDKAGPSVSPLNGVVASLAATEFMVAVTGLRPPAKLINFQGHRSKVLVSVDAPNPDCTFCNATKGIGATADVERYLKHKHLR